MIPEQQTFIFDGADYDHARDSVRLTGATKRIFDLMKDGEFRTLAKIARLCGSSENSASAILRHFRKPRFGSHTVNKEYIADGLYKYQLVVNTEPPPPSLFKENN